MMIFLGIMLITILAVAVFMGQQKFGRLPHGERLSRIRGSANYKNGSFQNLSHTPDLTEGVSIFSVLIEFLFAKKESVKPVGIIPFKKTDLSEIPPTQQVLVWFGHSSYFMQIDGKKILVDPVLSGSASPLSFTTRAFRGTDPYTADDIPKIDYLFISHDHWDHLDYQTMKKLRPRVAKIICGLGTGAHLERWGFDKAVIVEKDWNEEISFNDGVKVITIPARHFSGRGFRRNKSLWMSFILQTKTRKIFIGGDSGYDLHFAETGKAFGPFDLAILENGQYDKSWKYIHMMPEEVVRAGADLKARKIFPVHSAKFALGNHAWDDPLKRISAANSVSPITLITPMIGELVDLDDESRTFPPWWKDVN